MSKKGLFGLTNLLLIIVVGLLVGLCCKEIFSTPVGISAYICLIISLCIPSVVYFVAASAGSPAIIMSLLLMLGEMAINITCIAKPDTDIKIFGIVQACLVGLYLLATLAFIALSNKKEVE